MVACGYLKQKPRKRKKKTEDLSSENGKQKSVEKDHSSNSEDEAKEEGLLFEEDYHDSMNTKNFEKYFASLFEKLPKNSVIVIDNASYHSRNLDSYPKSNWRKQQLIDWLKEKNITIPHKAFRAELWTMAKVERENTQRLNCNEGRAHSYSTATVSLRTQSYRTCLGCKEKFC